MNRLMQSGNHPAWNGVWMRQAVATALVSAAGEVLEVNPAFERMVGVEAGGLRGGLVGSLVREDERVAVEADVAAVAAGRVRGVRARRGVRRGDGLVVDCEMFLGPVAGAKDRVMLLQLAGMEARVALEAERRKARWWLRAADGGAFGIYDHDTIGKELHVSGGYVRHFGYEPADWGGGLAEWSGRIHPDDFRRVMAAVRALFRRENDRLQIEYRVRHRDGSYRWVLDRGRVVEWTADGHPARVVGTHVDITERKQAEEELARRRAVLGEVLERMPFPVLLEPLACEALDGQTGAVVVSRGLTETFGLAAGEFGSVEGFFQLAVSDADERARVLAWLAGVRAGQQAGVSSGAVAMVTGTGGQLRVDWQATVVDGRMVLAGHDLTDRIRSEVGTETAFRKMKLAIQAAKLGFWEYDAVTGREEWDDAMLAIYGVSREEFDSHTGIWERMLHPEDRERVLAGVERVRDSSQSQVDEVFRIVRPDGAVRHVRSMWAITRDAEGKLLLMTGVNQDITAEKMAEESLRRRQSAIRQVLENLPIPALVCLVEPWGPDDLRVVMVNRRFAELFGYGRDELPSVDRWLEQASPGVAERAPAAAWWRQVRRNAQRAAGAVAPGEFRVVGRDGEAHEMVFEAAFVHQSVLVTLQDMTQWKRARQELAATRDALEKQALELTRNIPVGTFVLQLEPQGGLVFRFVSDRWLEMIGLRRVNLELNPAAVLRVVHPDDLASFNRRRQEAVESLGRFSWVGRLVVRGSVRWMLLEANPRQTPKGILLWEGAMTDITRRKEAELALAEAVSAEQKARQEAELAREAAERATAAKSRFLSNISQEIRTPLGVLVELSRALWEESTRQPLPPEFADYFGRIRAGGHYLDLLLTNLLDVSSLEGGRPQIRVVPFDLAGWRHEVDSILRPLAGNRGLRLEWDVAAGAEGFFRTDPVRLTQIVLNLAHNAVKFSYEVGERVVVSLAMNGRELEVGVADEGPGVDPAHMEQLFGEFQQSGQQVTTRDRGVGLGLAVVKQNTLLLGGRIRVEHREPRGLIFRVALPEQPGGEDG